MTNKDGGFRENGYCNLPPYEMPSLKRSDSNRIRLDSLGGRECRPVSESSETESQGMVESERMTNMTPFSEDSVPEADADTTLVDEADEFEGMSTIRRVVKPEPVRPPRSIDGNNREGYPPASKDYYNLVNPPPEEEEDHSREGSVPPAIPRRKPLIASPDSPKRHTFGSTEPPRPRPLSTHSCFTFSKPAPESEVVGQKVGVAKGGAINTLGRSFRKKYLSRRRRGTQCHCKNTGSTESKDEVILLYSRHCAGSMEWAKYLHKLFTELSKHKGKLRMRHLPLEDLTPNLPPTMESEILNARLQLVVVSPLFLQWVYRNPGLLVGRLLQQDRVIALLLGVKDTQVTPEHRSSLISFPQWVHLEARDHDLEFVQTVLYFSTQILQRTEPRLTSKSESLFFSVFPRKVTEFLNKVMIVLDKPVNSRAIVKVSLEKSNSQKVLLEDHDVKAKNPYNFLVTIPVCFFSVSSIVNIHLEVDGESRGFRQVKCESKMNELDTVLTSVHEPLEFLCQSMGISPPCKDQLDQTLTNNLMSNIPKHGFPLLSFSGNSIREPQHHKKQSCEFPSLLHFSAAHGLEQLTCALLDCPGAEDALSLRNVTDLTPPEMATANGFYDLGEILKTHHHSPSNFSHIYDYIKHGRMSGPREMSTLRHRPMSHCTEASIATSLYSGPDPQPESLYQVPPPPRPLPMSPGSCSPPSKKPGAYLDMSGSNSGTPSPCQKRRPTTNLWANNIKKKGNLQTNLFGTTSGPQRISSSSSGPDDSPLFRHLPSASLVQNEEDKYEEILDSAASLVKSKMNKNNTRDPFGTLRASQGRRSMREKTNTNQEPEMRVENRLPVDERTTRSDPFGTMRACRASSVKTHISSSQDDVFTPEELERDMPGRSGQPVVSNHADYRGISNDENRDDLAVTDELLDLLEDFKAKSYTVKEMEVLFENWRRKASIGDEHIDVKQIQKDDLDTIKEKLSKTKTTYSLLKMFRSSSKNQTDPKIKRTQSTKKYMKPSSPAFTEETCKQLNPFKKHENGDKSNIVIGNTDLNESELSMVALPPTPLKPKEKSPQIDGVSSQILPLSRLSSSSLPAPANKQKPIAEVSPFSNKQNVPVSLSTSIQVTMEDTLDHQIPTVPNNTMAETPTTSNVITTARSRASITPPTQLRANVPLHTIPMPQKVTHRDLKTSPMKDKLQKLRRSITEPLLHYLNEMHMMSPESEEPDILNTPKSLIQTKEERDRKLSKNLFGSISDSSMNRHPAPTSQVHEYENISPTPSTDL